MKKVLNCMGVQKRFGLILVVIMFFSIITNVYAETLEIDKVSEKFNKSTIIEGLKQLDLNFVSEVDTTNKTFDIIYNKDSEDEEKFSFTYNDDYIEYDNRSTVITEENYMNDILINCWIQGIIESIFALSGYENKTISGNEDYTNTFESYGIQLETESYNFSGNDEDGSTYSISGENIKYFKISLDTDKIESLIEEYGEDIEEEDSNREVINSLTPTIEAKEITENSVMLYPSINYYNIDTDSTVYCYIYRSDDENGVYEKISDFAVNCLGGLGIKDENLKTNTTYYYKTIVDGGTIYSNTLKVTTKNTTTNTDDDIENPKTGVTFTIVTITIALLGSLFVILYSKNKSIFKKYTNN